MTDLVTLIYEHWFCARREYMKTCCWKCCCYADCSIFVSSSVRELSRKINFSNIFLGSIGPAFFTKPEYTLFLVRWESWSINFIPSCCWYIYRYDGSIGSSSRATVFVDQFMWQLSRRNRWLYFIFTFWLKQCLLGDQWNTSLLSDCKWKLKRSFTCCILLLCSCEYAVCIDKWWLIISCSCMPFSLCI